MHGSSTHPVIDGAGADSRVESRRRNFSDIFLYTEAKYRQPTSQGKPVGRLAGASLGVTSWEIQPSHSRVSIDIVM